MPATHLKLAILATLASVAWACSGGGGSGSPAASPAPTAPSPAPAPSATTITITGQNGRQSFTPNPASVGGQMVVFRNADSVVHRVQLNDGSVDTGDIAPGATSRAVMMPDVGTNYHCSLHPAMIGAINPPAGGAPPPCEGPYCDGEDY